MNRLDLIATLFIVAIGLCSAFLVGFIVYGSSHQFSKSKNRIVFSICKTPFLSHASCCYSTNCRHSKTARLHTECQIILSPTFGNRRSWHFMIIIIILIFMIILSPRPIMTLHIIRKTRIFMLSQSTQLSSSAHIFQACIYSRNVKR